MKHLSISKLFIYRSLNASVYLVMQLNTLTLIQVRWSKLVLGYYVYHKLSIFIIQTIAYILILLII